jgi:protein-tyrosine-phosphatase
MLKTILFVCSGNTCRSPLAEGIAKKVLSEGVRFDAQVVSAGTSAPDGSPASGWAIQVAKAQSLDLSKHRARLLTKSLLKDADLVVVMGAKHREMVGVIEPPALAYTYLLAEFSDEDGDIADPMGGGREMYERTYARIYECVKSMKEKLKTFDGWKKRSPH